MKHKQVIVFRVVDANKRTEAFISYARVCLELRTCVYASARVFILTGILHSCLYVFLFCHVSIFVFVSRDLPAFREINIFVCIFSTSLRVCLMNYGRRRNRLDWMTI